MEVKNKIPNISSNGGWCIANLIIGIFSFALAFMLFYIWQKIYSLDLIGGMGYLSLLAGAFFLRFSFPKDGKIDKLLYRLSGN